jgi:hypothetical protein
MKPNHRETVRWSVTDAVTCVCPASGHFSVKKSLTTTGQQFDTRLDSAGVSFSSLEDINMRLTFKSLVLTSAAFCATAAFAANHARVDVPFSFTAKGQSYPAGSYDITMSSTNNLVTLSSEATPAKQITWSVGPAEKAQAPAVVRFDQAGGDYTLKNVQFGQYATPTLNRNARKGVAATISIGGQ